MTKKILAAVAAALLGVILAASGGNPATAASGQSYLDPGQTLLARQYLVSGNYKLIMQADGNLVLYYKLGLPGQRACAASYTTRYPGSRAWMSPNGTFSVYTPSGAIRWTTAPYTTPSSEWAGSYVQLTPAGEAIVWDRDGFKFIFWEC